MDYKALYNRHRPLLGYLVLVIGVVLAVFLWTHYTTVSNKEFKHAVVNAQKAFRDVEYQNALTNYRNRVALTRDSCNQQASEAIALKGLVVGEVKFLAKIPQAKGQIAYLNSQARKVALPNCDARIKSITPPTP